MFFAQQLTVLDPQGQGFNTQGKGFNPHGQDQGSNFQGQGRPFQASGKTSENLLQCQLKQGQELVMNNVTNATQLYLNVAGYKKKQ